jgi:hypothetical protein
MWATGVTHQHHRDAVPVWCSAPSISPTFQSPSACVIAEKPDFKPGVQSSLHAYSRDLRGFRPAISESVAGGGVLFPTMAHVLPHRHAAMHKPHTQRLQNTSMQVGEGGDVQLYFFGDGVEVYMYGASYDVAGVAEAGAGGAGLTPRFGGTGSAVVSATTITALHTCLMYDEYGLTGPKVDYHRQHTKRTGS